MRVCVLFDVVMWMSVLGSAVAVVVIANTIRHQSNSFPRPFWIFDFLFFSLGIHSICYCSLCGKTLNGSNRRMNSICNEFTLVNFFCSIFMCTLAVRYAFVYSTFSFAIQKRKEKKKSLKDWPICTIRQWWMALPYQFPLQFLLLLLMHENLNCIRIEELK